MKANGSKVNSSETECNGKTESNREFIETTSNARDIEHSQSRSTYLPGLQPTSNDDCNGYVNCLQMNDDGVLQDRKKMFRHQFFFFFLDRHSNIDFEMRSLDFSSMSTENDTRSTVRTFSLSFAPISIKIESRSTANDMCSTMCHLLFSLPITFD